MSRSGVRFERALTASTACTPSRAALLSGRWFSETGVSATSGLHVELGSRSLHLGLPPGAEASVLPPPARVPNLGSLFRSAGFRTLYHGKWHVSDAEGAWPRGPATGLEAYGFSGWTPPEGHGLRRERWGLTVDPEQTARACDTLQELARGGVDRWLLVTSLVNPHDLGFYPVWREPLEDLGVPLPGSLEDSLEGKPPCQAAFRAAWADTMLRVRAARELLRAPLRRRTRLERWREYVQLYAHLTRVADAQVGRLLDALAAAGLEQDTCVVFLSDHGEAGGAHGMMQKWYQAYEEVLRVPLLFSNPRRWPRGRTTQALASSVDVLPTLLDLAGLALPEGAPALRGRSLRPVLEGEADSVQDAVLFATDDDILASAPLGLRALSVPQPKSLRAVRTDRYKFARYADPRGEVEPCYELYDLAEDPDELRNLAAPGLPRGELFRSLEATLEAHLAERFAHPRR